MFQGKFAYSKTFWLLFALFQTLEILFAEIIVSLHTGAVSRHTTAAAAKSGPLL